MNETTVLCLKAMAVVFCCWLLLTIIGALCRAASRYCSRKAMEAEYGGNDVAIKARRLADKIGSGR